MSKSKTGIQKEYINKNLSNISSCTVLDKLTKDIDQISTPIVKDVLANKFNNGPDMNAVVCMFDNLFLSTAKSKQHGLFHLSVHVTKWVKNLEKIDINSTSGFVYFSDILSDIKVIIKLPQYGDDYDEMIREYFIGVTEINKLRYTLPNFVYTFGAFICPMDKGVLCKGDDSKTIPFVVFENIPGNNIQKMLEKDKLSFSQYLGMFIQVLLALEVAQRTIGFCHFDFHTGNLMCRTIKNNCNYNVPLDNIVYEVTAKEYLPVIIDFGLSTVKHNETVVGSYTFPEHGMMHYMLPGVDMYKFLYYSCTFAQGNVQRQILNLMSFYGKDDPYKFLIGGDKSLDNANEEYVKKGSYSRVTTYTPLEFLNWILIQPEYQDIVPMYMKKKDRDIYVPLSFSTTIQTYDDMFKQSKIGREKAIGLIDRCVTSHSSYIMSKYFLYILNGYNRKLKSGKLKDDIRKMKNDIKKSRTKMIDNDIKMLWEYKKLELPGMIKIQDDSKRILNIRINSKKLKTQKNQVLKLIERYFQNISFFTEILPYLQFVYTIREIKSGKIYANFLGYFLSSSHYKIYEQHHISVNRTFRWCHSLIDSLDR
jgi:hypothetical protein